LAALALFGPRPAVALEDDPQLRRAQLESTLKNLRSQAQAAEKIGDWGAAADRYEDMLRLDRQQPGIKERYQHCLRRYFQVVRFRDASYRKEVLTLKYSQALRLYEIVLYNLLNNTLDKDKLSAGILFRKGLDEYTFALASPEYCQDYLGGIKPDQTRRLRQALKDEFADAETMSYEQAVEAVKRVVSKSSNHFPGISPTTVVLEMLCGACHALDEYTVYLTPRQLRELCDTLKGRYVGVGIRIRVDEGKIVIAEVLPESPAAEAMPALARDDQILAVGGESVLGMNPEAVLDLLEGEEGTEVRLVILSTSLKDTRIVSLRRRALVVPSVSHEILPNNLGYLKIHCFQESTLQEFEAHLAKLLKADCKAIILDLRGNPGGLLDVAVDVARRFLPTGVIVSTQHQDPKNSTIYQSQNPGALTLPLAVLVDGDTASAAEVLAGALKDNNRARVLGQTTYGKGCSQGLLKLPTEGALRSPAVTSGGPTGAIRITIARFFSPSGQPYTGRGVEPDIFTDRAREEAESLLAMSMMN
jgi:carboxyl-terminal processing protease